MATRDSFIFDRALADAAKIAKFFSQYMHGRIVSMHQLTEKL
jgi:hypothetical protein